MTNATQSEYIRYQNKSPLMRRWIATTLLKSDLETHLTFNHLNQVITSGFDTSKLTKENQEDAAFIRAWLASELKVCEKGSIDESDIFAINTQRIATSMGLDKVELAVLRFACLVNGYKPLQVAANLGSDAYTEADVCDLLSELLCLSFGAIYAALQPMSLLRQSGLIQPQCGWSAGQYLRQWLAIPEMLSREIFRAQDEDNLLINVFYKTGPKSTLKAVDFPQQSELRLLKKYLRASIKEDAGGVNVLLWGPPGTGKTQMARHVAQSLRKRSLEISTIDGENRSLSATDRLDCYRFCQAILARSSNAIVMFDEVEDILCDGNYSRWGFRGNAKFSKSLMNTILETNRTPAIWITNTVDGVDPAYLRRFDFAINLKTPKPSVKARIASKLFKGLPIDKKALSRLSQHKAITPAHMQKVSKICQRVGVSTAREAMQVVNEVINGDLKAVSETPLVITRKRVARSTDLPYKPELINCDAEIETLADNLRPGSSVRVCCFGPPGTGKTAWARYLAKKIRRPLLIKRASDILDKYVGGTEQNIAEVFEEATSTSSILMLDEMDSFLPNRANAHRQWEVTQANQFLTAMEEYTGILICSTNLMENLDPATMRRFDFKINFDYLEPAQACEVALDLLEVLRIKANKEDRGMIRAGLASTKLAHGDFAALLRRYRALRSKPGWEQLVTDLKAEASYRDKEVSRPIGFLANI